MDNERHPNDNYETSSEAIDKLLSHTKLEGGAVDPGCGRGNIVLFLSAAGVDAMGIDKHHYVPVVDRIEDKLKFGRDFLETDVMFWDYKNIVMNPPFNDSDEHVRHALRLVRSDGKLCVLLRLTWIAAKKRRDLLDHLAKIIICGRLKMLPPDVDDKGHNGAVDFAWFIFEPRMVEATKIVRAA